MAGTKSGVVMEVTNISPLFTLLISFAELRTLAIPLPFPKQAICPLISPSSFSTQLKPPAHNLIPPQYQFPFLCHLRAEAENVP